MIIIEDAAEDEEVNKENDKGMQVKHTESVAYGTNGILKTITFDGHEKLTWEEQLQFWQVENEMMDSDRKLREEMRMSWYIKLFNKIVGG